MTETVTTPEATTEVTPAAPVTLQQQLDAPIKAPAEVVAPTESNKQSDTVADTDPVTTVAEVEAPAPEVDTEYPTYGDESADAAVSLLKSAGLTPEQSYAIFLPAAESLDVSKIDSAALIKAVGKEQAAAVLSLAKDYFSRTMASANECLAAAKEGFGGESQLKVVVDWVKKTRSSDPSSNARFNQLNAMLDLGPDAARMAAKELVSLYNADPKNSSLTIKIVGGDKPGGMVADEPINQKDYIEAMKKAHDARDYTEVNRLRSQRLSTLRK